MSKYGFWATKTYETCVGVEQYVRPEDAEAARSAGYSLVPLVPSDRVAELEAECARLTNSLDANWVTHQQVVEMRKQRDEALSECARLRKSIFYISDVADKYAGEYPTQVKSIADAALAAKGGE